MKKPLHYWRVLVIGLAVLPPVAMLSGHREGDGWKTSWEFRRPDCWSIGYRSYYRHRVYGYRSLELGPIARVSIKMDH